MRRPLGRGAVAGWRKGLIRSVSRGGPPRSVPRSRRAWQEGRRPDIPRDLSGIPDRAQDDDRRLVLRQVPICGDKFLAAHPGQPKVEDDDSGVLTLALGKRLDPVACLDDLETIVLER